MPQVKGKGKKEDKPKRPPIFGGPDDGRPHPGTLDDGPRKEPEKTPRDPRFICITSNALHWDLYYFLGDGIPTPTGGVGGFEPRDRPRRKAGTNWSGQPLWELAIPLMIDSWADADAEVDTPIARRKRVPKYLRDIEDRKRRRRQVKRWRRHRDRNAPVNVEEYVNHLVELAQPIDRYDRPPVIRVYGRSLPPHLNGDRWVISGIDWLNRIGGSVGGHARRQELTINLMEWQEDGDYKFKRNKKSKSKGDGAGKKGKQKQYTVKRGDTLYSIAAKFYGDRNKWRKIAEANGLKGPRGIEAGDKVTIP